VVGVIARYRLTLECQQFRLVTKRATAAFGQGPAMFILWPYWRQHVNATLSSMSLPAYSLPLYRDGFFQDRHEVKIEHPQ
jgi:hypothetical protein